MKLLAALTKLQSLHTECLTGFQRYTKAVTDNKSQIIIKQLYDGYAHRRYLFDGQMEILRQVARDANILDLDVPTVAQHAVKEHRTVSDDEFPSRVG